MCLLAGRIAILDELATVARFEAIAALATRGAFWRSIVGIGMIAAHRSTEGYERRSRNY